MALLRQSSSRSNSTSASVEDLLDTESNNNNSLNISTQKWISPTKETRSSRQRREMNAGKGVRMRSKTTGSTEDLTGGPSSWAKDKLMEQKRMLKHMEDELQESRKMNISKQEKLEISDTKINELIQSGAAKDSHSEAMENDRLLYLKELDDSKVNLRILQQKLSSTETNLETKDNSLHMCQKSSEEKDKEIVGLRLSLEQMQEEKTNLVGQYTEKFNDQSGLTKTLQHEIELLKNELDKRLETSSTVANKLQAQLKASDEKCNALSIKRKHIEESCQKYETEISNRIRENLHIMEDYDKAKAVEHKQLNFINELTQSNQELTTALRKQQTEVEELKNQLSNVNSQVSETKDIESKTSSLLENEKQVNVQLEEKILENGKSLTDRDASIKAMAGEIKKLKESLVDTRQKLVEVTNYRDQYMKKVDSLEQETIEKDRNSQSEKENFIKLDQQQTDLLNQLVQDLESVKEQLHTKTELANNLSTELKAAKEVTTSQSHCQLGAIQGLELQLVALGNTVDTQKGNLGKLQNENTDINQKLIEQIEKIEVLKLENANLKSSNQHHSEECVLMGKRLDDLTKACERKEEDCQTYRDNIELFEETTEKQGNIFADLADQNEFLKAQVQDLENEEGQLKMNLGSCVEKHREEISRLQNNHLQTIGKLRDELAETRSKSQVEINELLNNFNEVENELSFCQDEILGKTKELNAARDQLNEITNASVDKEQKLLQDLETLNEQNENILQSEIRKYKLECEEKVMALQKNFNTELSTLQNQSQAKLTSLKQQHENELREQRENAQAKMAESLMVATVEKENLQEKYASKSAEYDRIRIDTDTKLKSKEVELTSKSRIIDQLGRRIETQQKLVDYMMKALEAERSKQNSASNTDVMQMLANLQSTLDDKLAPGGDPFAYRMSPSSTSSVQELAFSYSPRPLVHSSTRREVFASTSEPVVSPIPSPSPSPFFESFPKDEFGLYLASSPIREPKPQQQNATYPWTVGNDKFERETKSHDQNAYYQALSKSLPVESAFVDLGYASPTLQSKNTKTLYFGEQIQTIMRTFEKLESLHDDTSPSKELNLEIWKQKIHFRLKVLEDQMDEMDTISNASSNASGGGNLNSSFERVNSPNPVEQQSSPNNVTFHPTTHEIRQLIHSVNHRYQRLGQKYLANNSLA